MLLFVIVRIVPASRRCVAFVGAGEERDSSVASVSCFEYIRGFQHYRFFSRKNDFVLKEKVLARARARSRQSESNNPPSKQESL